MRRHTSDMKFRFLGDTDKAKTLIPLARKLMGGLLESAKHNNLKVLCRHWTVKDVLLPKDDSQKKSKGKAAKKQAEHDKKGRQDRFDAVPEGVEYPDNSTIDVYWYANICLAVINVPRVREKREGVDMLRDICLGFILNITVLDDMSSGNYHVVPAALEPDYDSDGPVSMADAVDNASDDGQWVRTEAEFTGISWNDSPNQDAQYIWQGFTYNGLSRRSLDPHQEATTEVPGLYGMYQWGLVSGYADISGETTGDPPRVITLADGAEAAGVTPSFVGHIQDIAEWRPYFIDSASTWGVFYSDMVNTLEPIITGITQQHGRDNHRVEYISNTRIIANENDMFAGWGNLVGNGNYTIDLTSQDGMRGARFVPTTISKSFVALLPDGSSIVDGAGVYDFGADPDYTTPWYHVSYEGIDLIPNPDDPDNPIVWQNSPYHRYAVEYLSANPFTYTGGGTSTISDLYPPGKLGPLEYYLDTVSLKNYFDYGGESSIGVPDTSRKSGFYHLNITSFFKEFGGSFGTVGQFIAPGWEAVDGIAFHAELKVFGSGFVGNLSFDGITGTKKSKLKIKINEPIEFEEGNSQELFQKLVVFEN